MIPTFDAHTNLAVSAVATAPSPATSGTSLVVTTGHGSSMFPAAPFYITVGATASTFTRSNAEVMRVTNKSTDTFTVVRAQGGTTARTVIVGDVVAATFTAEMLRSLEMAILPVVRPDAYGTIGTADDGAAWTALMTAVGATPCIIYVPPGTTTLDGGIIKLDTRQYLIGDGPGVSIVKLKASATSPILVSTKSAATLTGTNSDAGEYQFGLRGLTTDGNAANNTGIRPIGLIPGAVTPSTTTGTLIAGNYVYRITAKTTRGETVCGPWVSHTLASTGGVSLTWSAVAGASGYNIYGRQFGQPYAGPFCYLGTTAGTTFTDNGSVTPGSGILGRHDASGGALVHFYGYNYYVRDVDIIESPGIGHLFEWNASTPAVGTDMECRFDNVRAMRCYGSGGVFYGPHDSNARSLFYATNALQNTTNIDNFVLANGPLDIGNIHCWGQARYAIAFYGVGRIAGMRAEGAVGAQLFVYNSECDIAGEVYFPGSGTAKGVVIGDSQYQPGGMRLDILARQHDQFSGAAFDLTYLGDACDLRLRSDQTLGTAVIAPTTQYADQIIEYSGPLDAPAETVRRFSTPLNMEASTPSAPSTGMTLHVRNVGGRLLPAIIGPAAVRTSLQPFIGRNKVAWAQPNGNSTTINQMGIALTATGTATAANVATTNLHTYLRRLEYLVTAAATTAVAGFRSTAGQFTVGGNAAGRGGFHFVCQWGPATGVATTTNRAYVGMSSTGAPTDVEPSTITNSVGMGWDAADANLQIMHRGAGAVTKINLGASFPVPTADRASVYELVLFSPPGTTRSVGYIVTDLVSGAEASGTITTNLPSTTTLIAPKGWMSVGGTSSVIGIALMNMYLETDL